MFKIFYNGGGVNLRYFGGEFTSSGVEMAKKLVSIAPFVRCIHAEPFGFQVKDLGEVSKEHRNFFIKNGWNLNFASTLKKANQNGDIIIEDAMLEYSCGTNPFNPTSIAVYRSV